MRVIPFEELKTLLEKIQNQDHAGYHLIYDQTKIKEAIDAYDSLGMVKYVLFAPRYHQLIEKARDTITIKIN